MKQLVVCGASPVTGGPVGCVVGAAVVEPGVVEPGVVGTGVCPVGVVGVGVCPVTVVGVGAVVCPVGVVGEGAAVGDPEQTWRISWRVGTQKIPARRPFL